MKIRIKRDLMLQDQNQIDLAAGALAQIFIQQVISKRNTQIDKKIDNKYGK